MLALRGDASGALDALEQAVRRGWRGWGVSDDLADYPAFDAIISQPRFTSIQARLRRELERERREVEALNARASSTARASYP